LSGTGLANTVVRFSVDGTAIAATTSANPSGLWSFTPTGLADGTHTIVASQTDGFGNTGTASLTFDLDSTAPVVSYLLISPVTQRSVGSGVTQNANTFTVEGVAHDSELGTVVDVFAILSGTGLPRWNEFDPRLMVVKLKTGHRAPASQEASTWTLVFDLNRNIVSGTWIVVVAAKAASGFVFGLGNRSISVDNSP
jgi:Bacterial Ig-like domain